MKLEIGGGRRLKAVCVVKSQGRASGFQGGPMPHLKATLIHDKQTSRHLPNIHKATQHNSMTPEGDLFREKSAASGGTRTHDTLLSRPSALSTELLR